MAGRDAGREIAIHAHLLELDAKRPGVDAPSAWAASARACPGAASIEPPAMMPIVPSPVANVVVHLGEPRDLIERFEEGLAVDVEIDCGVGDLGPELLAHVGDGVSRLLLKLLERFAQPDALRP